MRGKTDSIGHLSSATTSTSGTEQSEDEELKLFDDFQTAGWKTVFLLQFQPQFEAVIMIGIYISYICSLIDIAFAYSTDSGEIPRIYTASGMNFIYSFDVIYMIDILSMISYRSTEWVEMKHRYDERHAIIILLDIISIIPLDAVYFSLTNANMRVIYALRSRYILRIFRYFKRIRQLKNTVGFDHLIIEFLDFLSNFSLLLVTISCLLYLIECNSECTYQDIPKIIEKFYVITQKITSRGFPLPPANAAIVYTLYVVTNFFSYLYVNGFSVGLFLIAIMQRLKRQYLFQNVKIMVMNKLTSSGIKDFLLHQTFETFFSLYWKNKKGIIFKNSDVKLIPEVMAREISLDICWDLLKHSHLFRKHETHFLRHIAPLLQQKFLIPGEAIYKRNKFKNAMFYVVTGVIQILSEEDGETPILSFSGGTCIGESTLLIDYPSTCSVVCQSYCEVYVLYRKDFINISHTYPEEYRLMLKQIKARYAEAREYQDVLDFAYGGSKQKREVLILKWMKMTLHELLAKDAVAVGKYKKTLSLEDRHNMKELEKLVFCCKYLDMLVITEQIELVTDSVFLQTSCPCILQPDSFIVVTWCNVVAIAIFIFAFIYPYYAVFQPTISNIYIIFSYIISLLWGLDIYISISTAIKTKDGIITDISSIAIQKMGEFEFYLDIFAAVPLELFILLILGTVDSQFYVLLQAPRLLKMYKIAHLFDGTLAGVGFRSNCVFKYTIYMIYLMYYMAAVFHLRLCYKFICVGKDDIFINFINYMAKGSILNTVLAWINISSQLLTNIAVNIPAEGKLSSLYIPLILGEIVATLFYIFFLSFASATHALKKFNKLKFREIATNIKMVLKNLNVKPLLYNQVVAHLRGQMKYNEGTDVLYPRPEMYLEETHPELVKEARRLILIKMMKDVPLFTDLPDELLANIAQYFHTHMLVPGEVIVYAGEVCKQMHIILNGYCEVLGTSEKDIQVIGPGASISVVEMCFEIPIARTIITQTHCRLISLNHSRFIQAHQMYPEVLLDLKVVINVLTHITNFKTILNMDNIGLESRMMKEHYTSSFKVFGYHLDPDTKQGADYHDYFNKLGFFGFLRYIFPRHTIRPYGKFLHYWEISRCIFAFLTAILSPVALLSSCKDCKSQYILYFLDITAWIDIFIKHYICYFDEKGIEITHPLKTVTYYWKHGFILDVLGVLPFDIILVPILKPRFRNKGRVLLKMIRLLQTYRIFSGINYLDSQLLSPSKLWTATKFLPIMIVFANTFGSLVINLRCEFNSDIKASAGIFEDGVSCQLGTWVTATKGRRPLSPIRTHLYGLFVILVMLTGPGLGGFSVQNIQESRNMVLISTIGYLFFMFITSKIVATNLFRNSDLTAYQEEMRHLVKFLSCERIDVKLRKEVIEHFEYVWLKKKGNDLHKIIQCFNYALQEDLLLDVYGKALKQSTIFSEASDSFFRSLLLNVKHEIIMKRGVITRVNNVHSKLYIVCKGKVEVLGPDYNRLLILRVGSIFGNIDDCERSRQTLTMVARGHVELLSIPTTLFHKILSNYSKLKNHYHRLTAVNTDYLVGATSSALYGDSYINVGERGDKSYLSITSASGKSSFKASGFFANIKQLPTRSVWDHIFIVAICYFGSVIEFYQVTVHGHSFIILGILYGLDVLFLIHIYLNFRTAYENEYGVLVYDRKEIALHYIKNPLGFPLHVASVIPLELTVIFFMNTDKAWIIWSYCRCNRFIKVYYVVEYFQKKNQQLNINVSFMRTFFLLVWISLLLQALACILIIATCLDPPFSVSPPVNCNWDTMERDERYDLYAYTFSILLYFFTSTSVPEYFPNEAIVIFLVVTLLIVIRSVMTFFISEIATTLDITLNSRLKYEYNIQTLREHMVRERLSPALLERIWLYTKLLWKMHHGLQFPPLLEEAPYYLREAVLNSMFGYHLRRHALFHVCHVDMIRQIAAQLRTRIFFPGDYITFINDIDECMYFIHEGAVDCLSEENMYTEKIEKTLYKGEMFGFEQGMYVRCGHEYTYRANRHTVILILERTKWVHLLDFFPASKRLIYLPNHQKP